MWENLKFYIMEEIFFFYVILIIIFLQLKKNGIKYKYINIHTFSFISYAQNKFSTVNFFKRTINHTNRRKKEIVQKYSAFHM